MDEEQKLQLGLDRDPKSVAWLEFYGEFERMYRSGKEMLNAIEKAEDLKEYVGLIVRVSKMQSFWMKRLTNKEADMFDHEIQQNDLILEIHGMAKDLALTYVEVIRESRFYPYIKDWGEQE